MPGFTYEGEEIMFLLTLAFCYLFIGMANLARVLQWDSLGTLEELRRMLRERYTVLTT